jgi:hypothetical protein
MSTGGENVQGSKTLANVGKLTVSVEVAAGSSTAARLLLHCQSLVGRNVTNYALAGCALGDHVGQTATLHVAVDGSALLYMVGFA